MSFESGSIALTLFYMPENLPEDLIELFATKCAGKLDHIKDEPSVGWVSGRHMLESTIDDETALRGGHVYLYMRTAERKMPTALLNAICRREELVYTQANDTFKVPAKVKRDIKADALETHIMKMPPTLSGVPFVIDKASKMLYLGTASTAQIDNFLAFFHKTTDIEPAQINVEELMFRLYDGSQNDIPALTFSKSSLDEDFIPGRDFLTWLWFVSEDPGNAIDIEGLGEFSIMIEGPLTLAFVSEGKGAAETTLKKGAPLKSAEAKAALKVGKKLKKAKVTFVRGEELWTSSFDADKFSFSGLTLPEGEEMDPISRFAERVEFLHIFQQIIHGYFKSYVDAVRGDGWKDLEEQIHRWVEERDSY